MAKIILTVDDSASIRQTVRLTLTGIGYDVMEASSAKTAIAVCAKHAIDTVITDLNMPEMSGIELIKELRAKTATKFVPILMLTTESQPEAKQEGKAAGATGWIIKPFTPNQLVADVSKVCPLR